jgi:hypothetical protein
MVAGAQITADDSTGSGGCSTVSGTLKLARITARRVQ